MSNKLFILLLLVMFLPFLGWIIYDSRTSMEDFQKEGEHHGVLLGSDGSMAQVQYLFHFPEPSYHHDLNTGQIEALSQAAGTGEHYHVYGLTQADYGTGTHYEVNWSKKWFKEEYSMWVENLQVEFSYNTVDVYVTNSYDENSCEYQATLEHEKQHVEIHKQIYSQYQKIIRDALDQSISLPLSSRPIPATSIEDGKKQIGDIISHVVDPVFGQFKDALSAEQAKIDTPESYEGLRQKCQHW